MATPVLSSGTVMTHTGGHGKLSVSVSSYMSHTRQRGRTFYVTGRRSCDPAAQNKLLLSKKWIGRGRENDRKRGREGKVHRSHPETNFVLVLIHYM